MRGWEERAREHGVRLAGLESACYYAPASARFAELRCGREVVEAGRLGHLECREDGPLVGGELASLGDGALARRHRDEVEPLELVAQVPPGVARPELGDACEKQCQPTELDVRADAV